MTVSVFVGLKGRVSKGLTSRFYQDEPITFKNLCLDEFKGYPLDVVQWVISNRTLESVYQRIIRHETNKVFGYEALSRPYFKQRRLRPDSWFQSACGHALASYADMLAIESAFRGFQLPNNSQHDFLFINVMPASLICKGFTSSFSRLLHESNVPPKQVVLEIVEFGTSPHIQLRESIEQIRSLGICIALDDMGTGLSNLNRLTDLRPDFVKVDRSLIQGIAFSREKQRLLSLFVEYMTSSDSVIAEGIETREDLEAVIQSGVQLSQGFYWGKPSPLATYT